MKKLATIMLFLMALAAPAAFAQNDITVYHPNGATLVVPAESWNVQSVPKGYNTKGYNVIGNPKGQLPGWGGWPGYTAELEAMGCGDGLVVSPTVCPRQPYFSTLPDPDPEPVECVGEDELTLGAPPC